jgi:acyl-CoA synthetase (AMP-forming)/AMP-acid ligase II
MISSMPIPHVIHDFVVQHSTGRPAAEAVVDGATRLDFAALATQVDAIARGLLAHGVGKGDRVATLAPPGLDFWLTYLATVSIGAIWHGLNPVYREREFAYLLGDAEPSLVFARSPFDGRDYDVELQAVPSDVKTFVTFGEPRGSAKSLADFMAAGASVDPGRLDAARAAVTPDDIAVIVYTSGTTGQPKGAMLSHATIVQSALANAAWMGDRIASTVCAAPTNHVGALNNLCMNVFAGGGRIIFHHRVDMVALGRIRREEEPTYMVTSPTGFMMTMNAPGFDPRKLAHTRLIVCGGATTPLNILQAWEGVGCPIVSVYGQTETCGIITRTDIDAPLADVAETIGRPLPGCDFRVARADGTECTAGETGELQFRGPYVMSGYYNRPDATRDAFTSDGYLHTGDLGYLRADGNIVFVGRLKEMFKSGGYNVYPLEIEQAIAEHPDVLLAAVLPVPHPLYQEVGHAFVMPLQGRSVAADDLRAFLKARVANYKVPKGFTIEPALPLLPNGKIDKRALAARLDVDC